MTVRLDDVLHPCLEARSKKPDLHEMREELAAMMAAVRELRADQADLEARRQSITQQLRITQQTARDGVVQ